MFIALYTAFVSWIDDTYARDVIGVDSFNERFVTGRKQANEGLDGLDRLLRETNLHYNGIQASVILTATLNFVTSTILDFETQGMPVSLYWMDGWFRIKLMFIISGFIACQVLHNISTHHVGDLWIIRHVHLYTRGPNKILCSGSSRILFVHKLPQVSLFHSDPLWMIANTTQLVMFSLSIKRSWQKKTEISFPSRPGREDKTRFLSLESSRVMFRFVYQESKTS